MMKVVGEEGTSLGDFITYLKGEFLDSVYLQQDAFDKVDAATSQERQQRVFHTLVSILTASLKLQSREEARHFFQHLTQRVKDWNRIAMDSEEFEVIEREVQDSIKDTTTHV